MKLTRKLKTEILKVYNAYWDRYLKGDVKGMAPLLAEEYTQVGSAETEVFDTKRGAVKFLRDTIDQVAGKLEMRNRSTRIEPHGNLVLVHELCDVYVLADREWMFYSRFRASTLMQEVKKRWKIVHQHSSFPDVRTGEGDNIATEKIAAENQQLREAVKRRTIELEQKSRELEIETSLERVRAIAMGMKESADMLEVCRTISLQLESLGVKEIRNVQTAIFYESRGTYMNYEYYAKHKKTIITETSYTNHKVHKAFATKMLKGKGEVFITHIKGRKVKEWIAYQKTTNVFIDRFLERASSLNYYWHSLGPVALGISTYVPLSKEGLILFKRFLNVFELAYTRYLDIEQAHTQAREAQIEAALERVRAAAMSMYTSDDLKQVGETIFSELNGLGFTHIRNTEILINNDSRESILSHYYSDYGVSGTIEVFYNNHPVVKKWANDMKKAGDAFAEVVVSEKEIGAWRKYREEIGYLPDPKLNKAKSVWYYSYSTGLGALSVSSFSPITEEQRTILERFRNVFGLAYRRYADVARAEAHARESRIELSLERVRARSMAMHSSDELVEASDVVFQQLKSLGIESIRTGIATFDREKETITVWSRAGTQSEKKILGVVPHKSHPFFAAAFGAWKRKEDFYSQEFAGEEVERYYRDMSSILSYPLSTSYNPREVFYTFFFPEGSVNVVRQQPLAEEGVDIMRRFARVFGLMYRRFLDLQKAEAQAREAQIETALERVRSRTMGMQKSDELAETAAVLFQQFKEIDKAPKMLTIGIMNEKERLIEFWVTDWSGDGSKVNRKFDASIEEPVLLNKIFAAWKEQRKSTVIELVGKQLQDWIDYRVRLSGIPDDNDYSGRRGFVIAAFFSKGMLSISAYEPRPPETVQLLERFAGVFDLTYTRFLDLQKAEAQAREATIEASLEKVRGKAMAMHSSNDISETMSLVFSELPKLGISSLRCGVALLSKETRRVTFYAAANALESNSLTLIGTGEMTGHPEFERQYECWVTQEDYFVTLSNEALRSYYEALAARLLGPYTPREHREQTEHGYYFPFSSGNFYAWSEKPYSESEIDILDRFKTIIDLTFRRYLDLTKAEAQAREAQIEAALERVRSKTMAMHSSADVGETVVTMFDELTKLGIRPFRCGVGVFHDEYELEAWTARTDPGGKTILVVGRLDMRRHPLLSGAYNGWKGKESSFTYELKGEAVLEYFTVINNQLHYPVKYDLSSLPSLILHHDFYFAEGTLYVFTLEPMPSETILIFKRFAAVFGQTYRRYLDLQKAEAQAREARIEAALEKVRSRTMAMQRSDELAETAAVLFQQFKELGESPIQFTIGIMNEAKRLIEFQVTDWQGGGSKVSRSFNADINEPTLINKIYTAWKQQKKSVVVDLSGQELEDFIKYRNAWSGVTISSKDTGGRRVSTFAFFSRGHISFSTPEPRPQETVQLLERFAGVFDSTYTRFLDLQKAEAQARESQIEASLERVRSRTLAMQKSDELAETAAVLFRQLITLGIEPNRLYIAIVEDDGGNVEFWITDEDGSKVSSAFTANLLSNRSWKKMFDGWKGGQKSITIDMQGEELQEYFRHLNSLNVPFKGGLTQKRRVQNVAYFARGFIGIASPHEQPEETSTLLERFAAVFNLTFTRFNDLKLAEAQAHQAHLDLIQLQAEKRRAEDALSELSATQAQLVQQEKLASLGQLTAGIAHEIKNPLNFVNNFSSVSLEMVDEVLAEIEASAPELSKGEAPQLLGNIKANLGKIIEHGARADGIVKSMLQHSRGGTRKMEPTDVNTLIKEFVNLAFHGMRASKNPINVNIELGLDQSTGNVPLIAEDFSRVILNLCQNAFDAMREKLNSGNVKSYLPKLTVRTRRESNRVIVNIEDNGPGVPDAIKDKVLQPFFTTKKGTQGTGLGLSITNDIVKAHGGEMKIETNDSGGATFTIGLSTDIQK